MNEPNTPLAITYEEILAASKTKKKPTAYCIPEGLLTLLSALAKHEQTTVAWQVVNAIETYLESYSYDMLDPVLLSYELTLEETRERGLVSSVTHE